MRRRAFTFTELIVILVVLAIVATVALALAIGARGGPAISAARATARQLKDSSQIRGVLQGMTIWAANNRGQFPLPSALDTQDVTVPETGAAKDTTGNILSVLIYNGFFPVELTVSPAEVGNIRQIENYEVSMPSSAVNPGRALWDPGFSADFTGATPGHTSYANMAPVGARAPHWVTGVDSTRAILGNRGPQITSVTFGASGPTPALANAASNALNMHGPAGVWHGNIGYQDNSVTLETDMAPASLAYTLATGAQQPDTLFYDEPDDANGDNNLLTVTIPATGVAGGKPIWD